jgi:transcriptional regulator with XRE-family HTH domain
VAGLRREEVAQLVAISPDYYMRIEQGRLAPSSSVLAALTRVLRLDADQTAYVEGLVGQTGSRPQPRKRSRQAKVHPHLERLLSQLGWTSSPGTRLLLRSTSTSARCPIASGTTSDWSSPTP